MITQESTVTQRQRGAVAALAVAAIALTALFAVGISGAGDPPPQVDPDLLRLPGAEQQRSDPFDIVFDPDGPQRAEIFITAAQSAFGVMLIMDRRLTVHAGAGLLSLFAAQLITQFFFQDNDLPRYIFGIIYLVLSAAMLRQLWRHVTPTLRQALALPKREQPTAATEPE